MYIVQIRPELTIQAFALLYESAINELRRPKHGLASVESPPLSVEDIMLIARNSHFIFVEAPHLATKNEPLVVVGLARVTAQFGITGNKIYVDDVVVHKDHRGHGLGRQLIESIIQWTHQQDGFDKLTLTSNPSRAAAGALYTKLSFKERATRRYEIELAPRNRF